MALLFDSNPEEVNHGSAATLDNLPEMTYLFWAVSGLSYADGTLASKSGSGGSTGHIGYRSSATIGFFIATTTGGYCERVTNNILTANVWACIAYSYSATSGIRIYHGSLTSVMGEASYGTIDEPGSGNAVDAPSSNLAVGRMALWSNNAWGGSIALCSIWNRVLTLGELQQQQFHPRPTNGCVLFTHYGLVGTGTQPDWSGNGNTGTVTGATVSNHVPLANLFAIGGDDLAWVVASSGQTVSPSLIASTASIYAPTVTVGSVTVSPSLIGSTATVYAPTVTVGALTISPNLISSTAAVYVPVVTVGSVTVSPSLIASTASVYVPTVTAGAVTVSVDAIASTATVYAPTVTTGAVTVSANLISSTTQVFVPTVTSGLTIAPSRIESTEAHYQPVITVGAVTVSADRIESSAAVYAPTVTTGAVTVSPDRIESGATVYAPTVTQGAITISPARIESTAAVYAPTITTGAVVVSPTRIESAAIVYVPTVQNVTTQTVQPGFIGSTAVVFMAIVSLYTIAAERIFTVQAESRVFDVPNEDRTFTV